MAETRNSKVLASFVTYCKANPELRFWQALRNWSGHSFILVSNHSNLDFWAAIFGLECDAYLKDTFSWEGQNG